LRVGLHDAGSRHRADRRVAPNTFQTKAIGPNETPVRAVKNFADPELTNPSIVFVPHSKGKVES